jgi:hypothetical protein
LSTNFWRQIWTGYTFDVKVGWLGFFWTKEYDAKLLRITLSQQNEVKKCLKL